MKNVDLGLESALKIMNLSASEKSTLKASYLFAKGILSDWDYKFDLQSVQGAIFLAFEFNFATYFQETKIDDADVRRGIHGNVIIENFFFKEIHAWANETDPRQ